MLTTNVLPIWQEFLRLKNQLDLQKLCLQITIIKLTMHTQKALANLKEITLPDWAALQLEDHLAESVIDVSAMRSLVDRAEGLRNRFFESQ